MTSFKCSDEWPPTILGGNLAANVCRDACVDAALGSRLTEMDQLNAGAARNARHRSDERSNCGSRRLLGQERLAAWALCADRLNPSQASVSATLIGRFSGLRPTAQPRLCCDVVGLGKALDRIEPKAPQASGETDWSAALYRSSR